MAKYPRKPLSPYDPKFRETKMISMYDNGPKRHGLNPNDPRRICYCGDPDCTIGISDGEYGYNASSSGRASSKQELFERARERSTGPDDFVRLCREAGLTAEDVPSEYRGFFRTDEQLQMARAMRDAVMGAMRSPGSYAFEAAANIGPPSSYTRAREAVKDYILSQAQNIAWDDIIGNEAAHAALREAIEAPVLEADLYAHYAMKPPKGVLLYGPPGCGKTMFAKAAASAMAKLYKRDAAEVILIKGSQIQQPYVGATEEIIRNIFAYAREYAAYHKHPLVIFMDECEVFLPDRTGKTRQVMGWEESNVATMLAELDGLETLGAFLILATNRPEAVDEALLRDGRCDRKIKVLRPTKAAIYEIVAKAMLNAPLACQLDDFCEAVTECFFDPAYVIKHGHLLSLGTKRDIAINFNLEHIVNGGMAVSVAARAKSLAFARDKAAKTITGITVSDGIAAVRQIFDENKNLEHSFAINEFIENLPIEAILEPKGKLQ